METKVFSDPVTGLVRRIREVAIRQNGMVFLQSSFNFVIPQTYTEPIHRKLKLYLLISPTIYLFPFLLWSIT